MAHKHSVYDSDNHFSIDSLTRSIKNTGSKVVVAQYDHNSERFTFDIPRYIEEHDMSLCNRVEVHYINVSASTREQTTGVYEVEDLGISPDADDVVIFSWLISQNATVYVGPLTFIVRFVCMTGDVIDYVWNTAIHTGITVSEAIYNSEIIVEQYADVLEQWERRVLNPITSVEQTQISTDNGGVNEVTITLSDGQTCVVRITNGNWDWMDQVTEEDIDAMFAGTYSG